MRALTRICFALFLALFVTGAIWAQSSDQNTQTSDQNTAQQPPSNSAPGPMMGRGAHGQRGFENMAQELNLSDEQQTQMKDIFQKQRQQAQSIRQDTSLTPEQRRQKMQELRQSTHQQMMSILNSDQQQKWQQLQSQHKGMRHGKEMEKGMGPGGGMAALNLTPDQRSKLQPIFQSTHQQIMAVRNDSSLSSDQKQAKIRDIRQNTMAQVNSILTPEQQQQWQQMRQQRRGKRAPAAPPSGF
jgi:Spy/CpxP family protein refolding chaperone